MAMDDDVDPDDELGGAIGPFPCADWSLEQCAAALDAAAAEQTVFKLFNRVRTTFGVPQYLISTTVVPGTSVATAALQAWDYHATISQRPNRRIVLEPRNWMVDHHEPVLVRDASPEIIAHWHALLAVAQAPAVRARLLHLLWQRGSTNGRDLALQAADNYYASAESWNRELDAIEDLTASLRLSRAVGDAERAGRAIDRLLDIAESELTNARRFGVLLRALDAVVGERNAPDRLDTLLQAAELACDASNRSSQVLHLRLLRARTSEERDAIWERRVQAYIDHAAREETSMLKSVRLLDALKAAELSGSRKLRRRTAKLLEQVRDTNAEMMRLTSSSRVYEEVFDNTVEAMSRGSSWHESLVSFARYPPLTGDVAANRDLVRQRYKLSPLASLFPAQLYSVDGLPYLAGDDDQARFDIDLAKAEQDNLGPLLRPLAKALMSVLHDQPPPPHSVLAGFLAQWPGVQEPTAGRLANLLLRYWTGDSDGAAHIAIGVIERLARELVDGTGTYITQRQETPGQFPQLGGLIPLIAEEYHLDESRVRYLHNVLVEPAGLNLRNLLAHGLTGAISPPYSALLVHCALLLALIGPHENDEES